MFFLGHMAWAYIWMRIFAGRNSGKISIPIILILGIIPDLDLLFSGFGIIHHTFTHSFFFWLVLFSPFLAISRWRAIPYLVAVVQHFAFGDFIIGTVTLFWPFSSAYYGLNIAMLSLVDVALEVLGLVVAAGMIYFTGDLRRVISVNKENIYMLLPFSAIMASILFFTIDLPIGPLIAYTWSRKLLTATVSGHIILTVFLAYSTVQGLRGLISEKF